MKLFDRLRKSKQGKIAEQERALERVERIDSAEQRTEHTKGKTESRKPKADKKSAAKRASQAHRVLIAPIVSEKATTGEVKGQYTFRVSRDATKNQIKLSIQAVYGVTPRKVRTMHMEGKQVRFGVTQGRRSDWKKATVFLPKGASINIHEGV